MTTIIDQADADAINALLTSQNIEVRAHDDDPGSGSDNEAPGLDAAVIEDDEWEAASSDPTTSARGGRRVRNDVELEFAASAGSDGEIAYLTLWHEDDPSGAPGVYDVRKRVIQLTAPVAYSTGNRVYIPVDSLELFAAGAE